MTAVSFRCPFIWLVKKVLWKGDHHSCVGPFSIEGGAWSAGKSGGSSSTSIPRMAWTSCPSLLKAATSAKVRYAVPELLTAFPIRAYVRCPAWPPRPFHLLSPEMRYDPRPGFSPAAAACPLAWSLSTKWRDSTSPPLSKSACLSLGDLEGRDG